jgi:histidine triad (HIT) family protein
MDDCIFCRIAAGNIPAQIVLADERFVAFRDIDPKAPQHILIIPREHLVSLNDLEQWQACEGHDLLWFMVQVAHEVGIADSGYRVLTNVGPDARQEVQHMHFHLLGGEDLGDFR